MVSESKKQRKNYLSIFLVTRKKNAVQKHSSSIAHALTKGLKIEFFSKCVLIDP